MDVPSISTSALNAIQGGMALLDRGAAEMTGTGEPAAGSPDTLDIRSPDSIEADPMLTGIRDLFMARLEVGAGAVLMHAYRDNRQSIFDMLVG